MSEYAASEPLDTSRDVAWLAEADNARSGFGSLSRVLPCSWRYWVQLDCAKKMGAGEKKHVLNHDKAKDFGLNNMLNFVISFRKNTKRLGLNTASGIKTQHVGFEDQRTCCV